LNKKPITSNVVWLVCVVNFLLGVPSKVSVIEEEGVATYAHKLILNSLLNTTVHLSPSIYRFI